MKRWLCTLLAALLVTMASCGDQNAPQTEETPIADQPTQGTKENIKGSEKGEPEEVVVPEMDLEFTEGDTDDSYTSDATEIEFSEKSITVKGNGATADKTALSITEAGTYILSGNCSNGKITVSLDKNDKAKLVLSGLTLTCQDGAAIVVTEADKVFLTLLKDSENSITDGASYTETVKETNVDGAIFSRADLAINGEGTLTVRANNKHGIVSKDDLILAGSGCLQVTAKGCALEGKDCVKICEMNITVSAGGDGIRSTNIENAERGYVYVESGKLEIVSETDGIQAETLLRIDGGEIVITTGGGSAKAPVKQDNMMGGGFRPGGGGNSSGSTTTDSTSRKGLKCTATILLNGGQIQIDAYDDGIHSDTDVAVVSGTITVASGDDGVHAQTQLEIVGGQLSVTKSYEGLEGCKIYIKAGNISLVSSDDGINASDGSSSSGGFGGYGGSSSAYLCISGGYLFVNASGDGLDSNGNFDMMGGIVLVSGPTDNGNGALDYGDGCKGTVSGGILIAVGSSGMAENFTNAENQGSMLVNTGSCQAGTSIAVCNEEGTVLASFVSPKSFQTAVITAPGIVKGKTYTVYTGATVVGTDGNGFAENTTMAAGNQIATVEMTSLLYGSGGMGSGGMGGGGGFRPGWR